MVGIDAVLNKSVILRRGYSCDLAQIADEPVKTDRDRSPYLPTAAAALRVNAWQEC